MFWKRIIFGCMVLCLLGMAFPVRGMPLSAQSAISMERSNRRVLYEHNAHQKMGMASTTKIMTALIALEQGDLEEMVTVSEQAAGTEGSSMFLRAGEQIKLLDLLYGLLLQSGNDAAIAVAEHIGGDVASFCEQMNQKAEEIGAQNTHFSNPNGLAAEDHYTTAYDLALLTCYALEHPVFAEIVRTKQKRVPWEDRGYDRILTNHNKLLSLYPGSDGVKTGFTKATGRTLVSSATKNGFQVVAVTLRAPDDWNDHIRLLEDAFSRYRFVPVLMEGDFFRSIPLKKGEEDLVGLRVSKTIGILQGMEEEKEYTLQWSVPPEVRAPVFEGDVAGQAELWVDGVQVDQTEVYYDHTVLEKPRPSLWQSYGTMLAVWLQAK